MQMKYNMGKEKTPRRKLGEMNPVCLKTADHRRPPQTAPQTTPGLPGKPQNMAEVAAKLQNNSVGLITVVGDQV